MLRKNFDHGFPEAVWKAAKGEARDVMIEVARSRSVISYSDLVQRIASCHLDPQGPHLAHMLGEISSEEDEAGRGLLTVVVIHKAGDMMPGRGFFELANSLGRSTTDNEKFWIEELHKVYGIWSV